MQSAANCVMIVTGSDGDSFMRVLIAGGTLCARVCQLLAIDGHQVLLLTDHTPAQVPIGVQILHWDGRDVNVWYDVLQSDCTIINLIGAGQPLCDSYPEATFTIKQALDETGIVPQTLLQAASVAYYGDAGDDMLIEMSPPGDDSLAIDAHQWETITADLETRQCWLRFGHVLSPETDFRKLAVARQAWLPWIHVDDMARAIRFLLFDGVIEGPVNMVAPNSITYADYSRIVQAINGYSPNSAVPQNYASQRVLPQVLQSLGFEFAFADAEDALRYLLF